MHGPAELLPVSSSAHTALVPSLLGWRYREIDDATRKAFEVALHAGHGADLPAQPSPPMAAGGGGGSRCPGRLRTRAPIQRRLGGRRGMAAGLAAGATISLARRPQGVRATRGRDATLADAVCMGLAQATALVPGLSRSGMTIAAAQARGFHREAAWSLSREVALPVVAGAAALKLARMRRHPVAAELRRHSRRERLPRRFGGALSRPLATPRGALPFAIERLALAIAALWQDRQR